MLTLQTQYQSLLQEKDELKKQLIDSENWSAEAAKYSLKAIEPGIFVYVLNPEEGAATPMHWLCAHCYQNKQTSILEMTGQDYSGIIMLCFRCQNSLRVTTIPSPPESSS